MRQIGKTEYATCSKEHEKYKIPDVVKAPL